MRAGAAGQNTRKSFVKAIDSLLYAVRMSISQTLYHAPCIHQLRARVVQHNSWGRAAPVDTRAWMRPIEMMFRTTIDKL
jgi:hypothetical protein